MINLLKNILRNNNSTEGKEDFKNLELLCGLMIEAAYTDGQIDDIELNKIKKFEKDIIEKIKSEKPEILDSIQSTGKLEEKTEKILQNIIEDHKKGKK